MGKVIHLNSTGGGGGNGGPILNRVFKERFTGDGLITTFQLDGDIENGTFSNGNWISSSVQIGLPKHATNTSEKALYDAGLLFVLTRNRIQVVSISPTGLVTLTHAPQTADFFIYYWYKVSQIDQIDDYYRGDFVASMEADFTDLQEKLNLKADNIDVDRILETGLVEGGCITVNAGDDALVDVEPAIGVIVNHTDINNIIKTKITYIGGVGIPMPDIVNDIFTSLIIDVSNDLILIGNSPVTQKQRRLNVAIGAVVHAAGPVIEDVINNPQPVYNKGHAFVDYANAIGGVVVDSNISTPNADLTFAQTAGTFTLPFVNACLDPMNPTTKSNPATDPVTFFYTHRDNVGGGFVITSATNDIDPNNYDDGVAAAPVAIPVGVNDWTWQPVWFTGQFNRLTIGYGQFLYPTKEAALAGVSTDFEEYDSNPLLTSNSRFMGFFLVEENATDLTDKDEAEFISFNRISFSGGTSPLQTSFRESQVTGVYNWAGISLVDPTHVNIALGDGLLSDTFTAPKVPVINALAWLADSNFLISMPNAIGVQYLFIVDAGGGIGSITQQSTRPTLSEFRDKIFLAYVNYEAGSIVGIVPSPRIVNNNGYLINDFIDFLPDSSKLKGASVLPIDGALSAYRLAGSFFQQGSNTFAEIKNPNVLPIPADGNESTPFLFDVVLSDETVDSTGVDVFPKEYDVAGTPTSLTGKRATIHYLFSIGGNTFLQMGQGNYQDASNAVLNASADFSSFDFLVGLEGAILLSQVIIGNDVISFNDPNKAQILNNRSGGGNGGNPASVFFPKDHMTGLSTYTNAGFRVMCRKGECMDDTNSFLIVNPTEVNILNSGINGANALDVGGAAANTNYHLWLIAKESDGVSGVTDASINDKLIDSDASFDTDGTAVGDVAYDATFNRWAKVTAIDTGIQLSVDSNFFASGRSYIIAPKTVGMLSLSDTSPTMPPNYIYKRKLNFLRTDVTQTFLEYTCKTIGNVFQIEYDEDGDETNIFDADPTDGQWFVADCSDYIPTSAIEVLLSVGFRTQATTGSLVLRTKDSTSDGENNFHRIGLISGSTNRRPASVLIDEGTSDFEWRTEDVNLLVIHVRGFVEELTTL